MRADLDETIALVARRLREVVDTHGPDAFALYVSGQMSLEAQYLANKLAKGYVRTQWIESNSRLCMASAGTGYKLSLGADGPPGSYDDLDHADVFLVIGANMADCHPILFLRMLDRVKAGAKLIVVDPRRTATADKADLFLQVAPGTDIALLNGLLRLIVEAGGLDDEFVAEHTEGWDGSRPCSRTTRPTRSRASPASPRPTCARRPPCSAGRAAGCPAGRWGSTSRRTAPGTRTPWSTCTWRRARSAAPARAPSP